MTMDPIAKLEAQIETLIESNKKIMLGIYGNGNKGLKERVTELEIKFWIIFILLTPICCYALKKMVFGD